MSATISCTRCGRREGIVGATFREKQETRAALACRFCAILFPQAIPEEIAAELVAHRHEQGVTVEEAKQ